MGNEPVVFEWPRGRRKQWSEFGFPHQYTAGPLLLESPAVLQAICDAIPHGGSLLELGSFCGATAAAIADQRPDARILTVDLCTRGGDHPEYATAMLVLVNVLPRPNLSFLVASTEEAARLLRPAWDVVFVDANHEESACYADLHRAATLLSPTGAGAGAILVHDYICPPWPGVVSAVDRFCRERGLRVEVLAGSLVRLTA